MKKEIMCSPTTPRPTRTTIVLLLLLYFLFAHTSLARRRPPAAALVGCTQQYTAAVYFVVGILVPVRPEGVTRE